MQHSVPFDSSLKNDPPPHPGDDQSSKRAKLDDPIIMDPTDPLESHSKIPHTPDITNSASPIPDYVPETPMSAASPEEDVLMRDDNIATGQKVPSFKDKLLNNSCPDTLEEAEDDLVLHEGDVSIGLTGSIPTVDFATHVLETLNQKMGLAVVIKLMGRKIGFRQLRSRLQSIWKLSGPFKLVDLEDDCFLVRFREDLDYQNVLLNGPWMIFGHYLTVQPWSPSFKTHEHVFHQVIGWIRLPKLPARYYHKSIIRSIGSVFGEVIRVDYNTDSGDRGKFARLAVRIDLTKPLTSKIQVDGEIIYVEYEGLPTICFNCGRYGHLQGICPEKMDSNSDAPANAPPAPLVQKPTTPARDSVNFGDWMVVQRRPRRVSEKVVKRNTAAVAGFVAASRYEVLNEVDPVDDGRQEVYANDKEYHPRVTEGNYQKKKGKETSGRPRTHQGNHQMAPGPLTKNQDGLFASPHYMAQTSSTNLDRDHNSVITITDHRLGQRNQGSHARPNGSHQLNFENDPLANSRGFKLASGNLR
ncbi:hypothetical protein K1719_003104 [Acacia pycnantha]|nr:hypothetical protein K1719_003104 [Acacia pycnantha]